MIYLFIIYVLTYLFIFPKKFIWTLVESFKKRLRHGLQAESGTSSKAVNVRREEAILVCFLFLSYENSQHSIYFEHLGLDVKCIHDDFYVLQ